MIQIVLGLILGVGWALVAALFTDNAAWIVGIGAFAAVVSFWGLCVMDARRHGYPY